MENVLLYKQIDALPNELRQQVADFVEFLIEKYQKRPQKEEFEKDDDFDDIDFDEFNDEETEELKRRSAEAEADPDSCMDWEEVKRRIKLKIPLYDEA